jgi:hypothetical protein
MIGPFMDVTGPFMGVTGPLMGVTEPLMVVTRPLMVVTGPLMDVTGTFAEALPPSIRIPVRPASNRATPNDSTRRSGIVHSAFRTPHSAFPHATAGGGANRGRERVHGAYSSTVPAA